MESDLFGESLITALLYAQIYLYVGVLLLGCSAAIQYFLYLRLRDTGRKYVAFNLLTRILTDYLRARSQYGWSAWPAYFVLPIAIAGLVLLVVGVTRL
jgi:hypothetical protein